MSTPMEAKRAELLGDLAAHACQLLQDYGVAADLAEQAGSAIADHMADHWGGQIVTFPKDYAFRLAKRDLEILAAFTGNNHAELAKKYDMTERGIRKLLARALLRQRDLLQGKLFD